MTARRLRVRCKKTPTAYSSKTLSPPESQEIKQWHHLRLCTMESVQPSRREYEGPVSILAAKPAVYFLSSAVQSTAAGENKTSASLSERTLAGVKITKGFPSRRDSYATRGKGCSWCCQRKAPPPRRCSQPLLSRLSTKKYV